MPSSIKQAYNKKIGAWVKYKKTKAGVKILDVKEKSPSVPFKDVVKKGQKKY
jgi:hypothetical protein